MKRHIEKAVTRLTLHDKLPKKNTQKLKKKKIKEP